MIGMVSVSVAVRKCNWKINSQKQAFRNYGVITRLPCMYSIQEIWFLFFFYFFACVCVCVWIFVKTACCAQWTDNHIFIPFEQYGVFFSFFYVCGSDGKIDKKKKKYRATNRGSIRHFRRHRRKEKWKKKKREKEIKRRNKKKRKISYTILFIFPPHACIYVQKGRATMISRHFFLQATMEWFFFYVLVR